MNNLGIIYINLDKSTDRKENMESQLKDTKLNYHRFPAIDMNNDIYIRQKEKLLSSNTIMKVDINMTACLSHLYAIKMGYDKGYENLIVLEDDVCIKHLLYFIENDLLNIPINYNMLQLCSFEYKKYPQVIDTYTPLYRKRYTTDWGLQGSLYNRDAMNKVMDIYNDGYLKLFSTKETKFALNSDVFIYRIPNINCCLLNFPIVYEKNFKSDLGHKHTMDKHKDYMEKNKDKIIELFSNYSNNE